jgi:hypothetical protein
MHSKTEASLSNTRQENKNLYPIRSHGPFGEQGLLSGLGEDRTELRKVVEVTKDNLAFLCSFLGFAAPSHPHRKQWL